MDNTTEIFKKDRLLVLSPWDLKLFILDWGFIFSVLNYKNIIAFIKLDGFKKEYWVGKFSSNWSPTTIIFFPIVLVIILLLK